MGANSRMPAAPAMKIHLKPMRSPSTPHSGMVNSASVAPQTVASNMVARGMPSVPVA